LENRPPGPIQCFDRFGMVAKVASMVSAAA